MSANTDRQLSLVEIALLTDKMKRKIDALDLRFARDPAVIQKLVDDSRREAIAEAARLSRPAEHELTPAIPSIPTVQTVSERKPARAVEKKTRRRRMSKEALAALAKARDLYFKKKGYGKYAKKKAA